MSRPLTTISSQGKQSSSSLAIEPDEEIKNHKIKIALIGDEGVGKTTIATYFCKSFFQSAYKRSLGCEFYLKVK